MSMQPRALGRGLDALFRHNDPGQHPENLCFMSIEALDKITGRFEFYRLIERGLDDVKKGKAVSPEESSRRIEALLSAEV